MIAHVWGVLTEKRLNSLIIDVNGIGYEVQVDKNDYEAAVINDEIKLYTYHHIREQIQELYGFSRLEAKQLFELLITVQGVGPKAALAILSLGSYDNVRNAIANSDNNYIAQASGVGKKTAERVVIDLNDKVGLASQGEIGAINQLSSNDEAAEALMALGYNQADAQEALKNISKDLPLEDRIRRALKRDQG